MGAEFGAIAAALRQVLKARKLTYRDVAEKLGVSEQTIKRLFRGDDATVSRLVEICNVAGVTFQDVVAQSTEQPRVGYTLSEEQEEAFVAQPHVYAFFNLLREKETVARVRKEHDLDARTSARYLRELEAIGVIERGAGESFTWKVVGRHNFIWGGPLWKYRWRRTIEGVFGFIAEAPNRDDNCVWSLSQTEMTRESLAQMRKELHEVSERFQRRSERESKLLPKDQLVRTTWAIGLAAPYWQELPPLKPDSGASRSGKP